ncbi:hypothetical protein LTR86_000182 [Recurvomyces mirabilis]|nr:hypothetical protein LTR86_000182 [Recurvomyces mirabilis]
MQPEASSNAGSRRRNDGRGLKRGSPEAGPRAKRTKATNATNDFINVLAEAVERQTSLGRLEEEAHTLKTCALKLQHDADQNRLYIEKLSQRMCPEIQMYLDAIKREFEIRTMYFESQWDDIEIGRAYGCGLLELLQAADADVLRARVLRTMSLQRLAKRAPAAIEASFLKQNAEELPSDENFWFNLRLLAAAIEDLSQCERALVDMRRQRLFPAPRANTQPVLVSGKDEIRQATLILDLKKRNVDEAATIFLEETVEPWLGSEGYLVPEGSPSLSPTLSASLERLSPVTPELWPRTVGDEQDDTAARSARDDVAKARTAVAESEDTLKVLHARHSQFVANELVIYDNATPQSAEVAYELRSGQSFVAEIEEAQNALVEDRNRYRAAREKAEASGVEYLPLSPALLANAESDGNTGSLGSAARRREHSDAPQLNRRVRGWQRDVARGKQVRTPRASPSFTLGSVGSRTQSVPGSPDDRNAKRVPKYNQELEYVRGLAETDVKSKNRRTGRSKKSTRTDQDEGRLFENAPA